MSEYKRKAISGFFWQALGMTAQQGIMLIANLIFARILLKSENGVIVAAMAILDYATLVRVAGVTQAFVSYEGDDKETRHTVFWSTLISGIVFSGVIFACAPLASQWLHSPGLTPILRALCVLQLLDSLRIVPLALVWRHLRFKERALADSLPFIAGLLAAILGVVLLPAHQKIWAVVWMYVTRSAVQCILFYTFEPYRPKWMFDWPFFRLISKRGAGILSSNLPSSLLEPLPALFVVGRAGEAAGGAYGLAGKVTNPASSLAIAANQTLYPIFSKVREDHQRLCEAILRSYRGVGFISTAILAFLIVASPQVIPLVLGEKWRNAAPAAQWLSLAAIFRMYTYVSTNAMLAIGKTTHGAVVWWTTLVLALGVFTFVPIARGDALVGSQLTSGVLCFSFILGVMAMYSAVKLSPLTIARSMMPAFASAGLGLAASWGASQITPPGDLPQLCAKLAAFIIVFFPAAGLLLAGSPTALLHKQGLKELVGKS